MQGPRYHVYDNGTLRVSRATEEDAGSYTCWVENAKGKAAVTASLGVRGAWTPPSLCATSPVGPVRLRGPPRRRWGCEAHSLTPVLRSAEPWTECRPEGPAGAQGRQRCSSGGCVPVRGVGRGGEVCSG